MNVTEFLYCLSDDPEVMPAAPYPWTPRDVDDRRAETHACLAHALTEAAGVLADAAIVADSPVHSEAGRRWLDLCWDCYDEVKQACIRIEIPGPGGGVA